MEKVSKTSVNYREAAGSKRCGNCGMFHAKENRCDLVLGSIHKDDTCDEWVKK